MVLIANMGTTEAETRLNIQAVWSDCLLFEIKLALLCSERAKLDAILVFPSVIGLSKNKNGLASLSFPLRVDHTLYFGKASSWR